MTPTISIIIVHYRVPKELLACIQSIYQSKSKVPYEIIVVDNDSDKKTKKYINNVYPKVQYVQNSSNLGFGAANNIGAERANGEYLFFLNPDTVILPGALDALTEFLNKKNDASIAAPLLLDIKKRPYEQGTLELTPLRAVLSLSFLKKLFPRNPISRDYWLTDWNKQTLKEVDVSPGTAFVIRKNIFFKSGKFDEKFFLYFEEFDLCKKVRKLGGRIFILPESKVIHTGGVSTKQRADINAIFKKSRFYYFRKHFGLVPAIIVEGFLGVNKFSALLGGSLIATLSLSSYKLGEYMHFIGDQAWYYLSARDIIVNSNIPLVGIATSHPWLHQGALWAYMLAPVLWLFDFNPLSGAYLTIGLNLITLILLYKLGSIIFSVRIASIATVLYATSNLIIFHVRMPYHTSPIPLFTLIFLYALYKWIQGNRMFFPVILFTLAILYNLEIATFLLSIVFAIIVAVGILKRKKWIRSILDRKVLIYSLIAFLIPMLPMIVYDIGHGYPQTLKFLVWIGYKVLVLLGYQPLKPQISSLDYKTIVLFIITSYKQLVYMPSMVVAAIIAVCSFGYLFIDIISQIKTKKHNNNILLLGLIIITSISGIIVTKTTSDAYLPILFPPIMLVTAIFFDRLLKIKAIPQVFIWVVIGIISLTNGYELVKNKYYTTKGYTFFDRVTVAKKIISIADGRKYSLIGMGQGSKFDSYTMTYEYLTWWLGNGPSERDSGDIKIIITESKKGIKVEKKTSNTNS